MKIVLDGQIIPQSPLTVSPPGAPTPKGENIPAAAQMSGMPRMRLFTSETNGFRYVAYCPSSTIRGRIRREARDALFADLKQKWSLELHRVLSVGGLQQSGEGGMNVDIATYVEKLKANPFLGLFGASVPEWIRGALAVNHAVPETDQHFRPDAILGVRTDSLNRNPEEIYMLTPEGLEKYHKIQALFKELEALQAKGKEEEEAEDKEKEIAQLTDEIRKLYGASESGDSKVTKERQISGYEAIPPGTPLKHGFTLNNVSLTQFGLFIRALQGLSYNPYLGAKTSHGCGLIKANWEIRILNGSTEHAGECAFSRDAGFYVEGEVEPLINDALDAWNQYVSGITVDDLEELVRG